MDETDRLSAINRLILPAKLCKHCGKPMPATAIMCSECKSYQDWRGWLPISSTALALLTALVSVTGIVGPEIFRLFHTPKSDVRLAMPHIEETTIRILAVNRGDATASLIPARIGGKYLAGATKIRLRNDADAIIPPGSKLLTFNIIPLLDEKQSYDGSLEAMTAIIGKKPLPPTWIMFGVAQSDGNISLLRVELTDDDMFFLLRDNADRCSAIEKADFGNGCVGSGAPSWSEELETKRLKKEEWQSRTRMQKPSASIPAPLKGP